jgi:hypothetical protein
MKRLVNEREKLMEISNMLKSDLTKALEGKQEQHDEVTSKPFLAGTRTVTLSHENRHSLTSKPFLGGVQGVRIH